MVGLYAGILGILYFKISLDTIKARRKNQISLGFGSNNEIAQVVSAHANFNSYSLYLLFLLYILERSNLIPNYVLHFIAGLFTLGRFIHYSAFKSKRMNFKQRVLGMQLTLLPLLALSLMCLYVFARISL